MSILSRIAKKAIAAAAIYATKRIATKLVNKATSTVVRKKVGG